MRSQKRVLQALKWICLENAFEDASIYMAILFDAIVTLLAATVCARDAAPSKQLRLSRPTLVFV